MPRRRDWSRRWRGDLLAGVAGLSKVATGGTVAAAVVREQHQPRRFLIEANQAGLQGQVAILSESSGTPLLVLVARLIGTGVATSGRLILHTGVGCPGASSSEFVEAEASMSPRVSETGESREGPARASRSGSVSLTSIVYFRHQACTARAANIVHDHRF